MFQEYRNNNIKNFFSPQTRKIYMQRLEILPVCFTVKSFKKNGRFDTAMISVSSLSRRICVERWENRDAILDARSVFVKDISRNYNLSIAFYQTRTTNIVPDFGEY